MIVCCMFVQQLKQRKMKAFTLDYILNNMGCYVDQKEAYITKLFNTKQKDGEVSIADLFEQKQIPFKDRCWF